MKFRYINVLLLVGLLMGSCENLLEINPEGETIVLEEDALVTKSDMQELLNAGYDVLNGIYGGRSQRTAELLADNVVLKDGITDEMVNIYKRYTTGYFTDNESYREGYKSIMRANTVIENVDRIGDLTDAERTQMVAEAKFLRAICHFAIVRLFAQPYGFLPDNSQPGIVIKTNTTVEILARSSVGEVYEQIVKDLTDAEADLPPTNSDGAYATSWAAKAALANVYFQMHDYDNAYLKSNEVVQDGGFVFDAIIGQRFLASVDSLMSYSWGDYTNVHPTGEAIFKLVSDETISKKVGGDFGVFKSDGTNNPNLRIAPLVYKNEVANNAGDRRTEAWYEVKNPGLANEYIAFKKFNLDYMYVPVFYLTEQMMIRSESALLKATPDVAIAIADVNAIRERAFGNASRNLASNAEADAVLQAIRKERRMELMGEGNRLHDLKRIGSDPDDSPNTTIRDVPWDYVGLVIQFDVNEKNEKFKPNPEPN